MGKNIVHVGASGAGQVAKAANQIVTGMGVLAVAEALRFCGQKRRRPRQGARGVARRLRLFEAFSRTTASACSTAISSRASRAGCTRRISISSCRRRTNWGSACPARRRRRRCSMPWSARGHRRGRLHRRAQAARTVVGPGMKVGFIGLGAMGRPMALHLQTRRARPACLGAPSGKRRRPAGDGLRHAGRARAAAARSCSLSSPRAPTSKAVALGHGRAWSRAWRPIRCWSIARQSPPMSARDISARLGERGIHMLDAPVSGGTQGAIDATLAIMAGGDAAVLERVRPLLAVPWASASSTSARTAPGRWPRPATR